MYLVPVVLVRTSTLLATSTSTRPVVYDRQSERLDVGVMVRPHRKHNQFADLENSGLLCCQKKLASYPAGPCVACRRSVRDRCSLCCAAVLASVFSRIISTGDSTSCFCLVPCDIYMFPISLIAAVIWCHKSARGARYSPPPIIFSPRSILRIKTEGVCLTKRVV